MIKESDFTKKTLPDSKERECWTSERALEAYLLIRKKNLFFISFNPKMHYNITNFLENLK